MLGAPETPQARQQLLLQSSTGNPLSWWVLASLPSEEMTGGEASLPHTRGRALPLLLAKVLYFNPTLWPSVHWMYQWSHVCYLKMFTIHIHEPRNRHRAELLFLYCILLCNHFSISLQSSTQSCWHHGGTSDVSRFLKQCGSLLFPVTRESSSLLPST